MVKVWVYNKQKKLAIFKKLVCKQTIAILEKENILCDEIAINFVNIKTIAALHKKFFNDPTPTDCISFPIDNPGKTPCFLGELFICPEVALRYSFDHNIDPYEETALYLVHGILHLAGYDDIKKEDKKIMKIKEKSCMKLLRETNLIKNG
jgi:probable rRNA maturation factor